MDYQAVKKELIDVADELDRRGLTAEANEATRILAQIVDEEKAVQGPTPEQLMAYADQLDQAGKLEEADQVTAYAHQTAMVRSSQFDPTQLMPQAPQNPLDRAKYWREMQMRAVNSGNIPLARGYYLSKQVADIDQKIEQLRSQIPQQIVQLQQRKNQIMQQGARLRASQGRPQDRNYGQVARVWSPSAAAANVPQPQQPQQPQQPSPHASAGGAMV